MSSSTADQSPELRFSDYDSDLSPVRLLAVCNGEISNGVFNDPNKRDGNYRLVNVLDMFGTDQIDVDALSQLDLGQKEFEKNKVKFGDIFFTRSSLVPAGIAWSNVFLSQDENVTFDGHLMKISPDLGSFSPSYLAQYFRSTPIRKQLIVRGKTGTMTTIGQSDIASVEVRTPSLPEQRKIADFLTAVDGRIGQLIQRKALLENYKKGVMQQLFTQAIRFKDDHGNDFPDWEEKRVDEMFTVTRGKVLAMPETRGEPSKDYPYPVYSSQTKANGLAGYYDKYLFENAITWTTDGANAGDVKFRTGEFYCTNVCGVLLSDKGYANEFVASILGTVTRQHVSYVGNPKLMNNVMSKISISVPSSMDEQTKIADFLSAIDRKIESVATQITETQTFKRGLLQQMFV